MTSGFKHESVLIASHVKMLNFICIEKHVYSLNFPILQLYDVLKFIFLDTEQKPQQWRCHMTWSQVVTETLRSQPWDECTGSATTKIFCLNGLIKCLLPSGSCPAQCTVRCFAVLPPLHLPEHLPVWRLQPSCHFWFIQCCFGLRRVLLPPRSCRVRPSGHLSIFISIVWRTCLCLVVAS